MSETAEAWSFVLGGWQRIIDACDLTIPGISRKYEISYSCLHNWMNGDTIPREKSRKRMEEVLMQLEKRPRIQRHPSFGYATPEQIERLKQAIPEWERNKIMDKIEKQTKSGGKVD